MYLTKPKLSNRIKTISIENCIVKINDNNEIEKKISVEQIQKIYLKTHKQNVFLIYFCLIALISGLIVFYYSIKLVILLIVFLITSLLITKFSINKKKYFLYIKLTDTNSIYSIQFPTKKKEEILNVIWEIRKQQFEAS
jgi:hypothetical protein